MKIRIKGNSIRYRLTKSEVGHLASDGILKEAVEFNTRLLFYVLRETEGNSLAASFAADTIELFLPREMITELAETERIGFKADFGKLSLLVEKDFVCIDQTEEDQSDNYPHPEPLKC